jgi:hypothetical protein
MLLDRNQDELDLECIYHFYYLIYQIVNRGNDDEYVV